MSASALSCISARRARQCAFVLALVLSAFSFHAHADDPKPVWEEIAKEDGVTVWEKETPGRDLPMFRGVVIMNVRLLDIMAVLDDADRAVEWVYNCHSSKILKRNADDLGRVLYSRVDSPWPVDDRDVLVSSKVSLNPKRKEITIKFRNVKKNLVAVPDGVVRIPYLRGHYKLRILDDRRTRVEYVVDADPGGSLPKWLVAQASRDLPLETLVNLRKQTKKMQGKYETFIKKWDPAHGGEFPVEFTQASK